jgi:hypothetical protein
LWLKKYAECLIKVIITTIVREIVYAQIYFGIFEDFENNAVARK